LARHRGLTLIEVLVAMALSMLVTAALLTLFANMSANGQNLRRTSAHIENGRFAAELLHEDLRLAGFFGELRTEGALYSTPDPCAPVAAGYAPNPRTIPTPVRGYTAAEALPCLANRAPGTDALALRRLEVFPVTVGSLPSTNQQPFVQPSLCATDPVGTEFVFDRAPASFVMRQRDCVTPSPLRAVVSRIYFVASCDQCNGQPGDGPTLKRMDLEGGRLVETSLVDGVETLRFEYGLDLDGDGSADEFRITVAASGPASQWENVVALKVHYIVRSGERALGSGLARAQTFDLGSLGPITTPNDGYVRRAYSTVIRLHNPGGWREES
jgi:type IV pilus assembly protein PilW